MKTVAYYTKLYLKSFLSWKMLTSVLSSFGSLWIFVSILNFFLKTDFSSWLQTQWWLFLVSGCLIGVIRSWPHLSYRCRLKDRDIQIEIKVADLFRQQGAWIIGTNTTFDTEVSSTMISKETLQGQFTTCFYSDWKDLDKQVNAELENRPPLDELNDNRQGKIKRYPLGETIIIRPSVDRLAYLVAIADINKHGNASGTLDGLRQALAGLWDFIITQADQCDLVVPILGTGRTRLPQTREEIMVEIIRSFIAASTESTFCPKLTVVIHPSDVLKYGINLQNLKNYLWVVCNFNNVVSDQTHKNALGQGVKGQVQKVL